MITAILLLALGLLMIFLEIFLPGGILAVIGGVLILASIIFFSIQAKSLIPISIFILTAFLLLWLVVKFGVWIIKKRGRRHTQPKKSVTDAFAQEKIGKKGVALTDLKPSGYVFVDGNRFSAISKGGYISKGQKIQVIGGKAAQLTVELSETL